MKLPLRQANKYPQAFYSASPHIRCSSCTEAYVTIDFKSCAQQPASSLISFIWAARKEKKDSITTSVVAGLLKLVSLNYSSQTYLSAQSQSAVKGFKYSKDSTSNNSRAHTQLHKVTMWQSIVHTYTGCVRRALTAQRIFASLSAGHCAE